MTKRLTPARIERWRSDRAKATSLLDKIAAEANDYRLSAKGGRLSHLTDVVQTARRVRNDVDTLDMKLSILLRSETR